jgi:hypothetical protein
LSILIICVEWCQSWGCLSFSFISLYPTIHAHKHFVHKDLTFTLNWTSQSPRTYSQPTSKSHFKIIIASSPMSWGVIYTSLQFSNKNFVSLSYLPGACYAVRPIQPTWQDHQTIFCKKSCNLHIYTFFPTFCYVHTWN